MTTAAARHSHEVSERLCIEAITAVELYGEGMTPEDLAPTPTDALDLIDGLVLYCQLLETSIAVMRGAIDGDPAATRVAARQSATMWRKQPGKTA